MKWDFETFIVCCSVYLLCQQNEKWTDGLMYRSASHSFDAQQRPIDVYNISPYAYPPCPPESCVITPWWMKLCRLSDASPLWARSSWHRSVCSIENESRQAYLHGVKKPSWFIISSKELFTEELCWSWCEDSCYLCAECTTSCKGFSPHRFTRWKSTHKQRNVYVGCTTMGKKVFAVQNAGFIY